MVSALPGKIADYQPDAYVGGGGTGSVYLARDRRLRRRVALKVLAPNLARDAGFRTQLIRESRAAAALEHPHIVPVYAADEANGTLYVATRYIDGGDVGSLLSRNGPLRFSSAWHIVAQIASALDAAHAQGLIHRDVKPSNILLGGDDDRDNAYLTDFGMGLAFSPDEIIATDQFSGTLDYVAPEQIEGRALDGRADEYSLACVAFELLCGTPPFGQDQGLTLMYAQLYAPAPAATAKRTDLPAAVDLVLGAALMKNPADRYPSCGQFAEELRAALGVRHDAATSPLPSRAQTLSPAPAGPVAESPPPVVTGPGSGPTQRSHSLRLILSAAAVVLVAAGVTSGVVLSQRSPQRRPEAAPAVSAPADPSPSSAPSSAPSSGTSPSASPAPTPASEQAAAVSTLLTSSAASRTALRDAINQVGICANLSGATSQLQAVVNQRVSEYGRASALPTSALPDGTTVKSALIAALSGSLKADRDYLTWAQQQADDGCVPSDQSGAYSAAFTASQLANDAKEAFVQLWNPVAAKYGIKPNSPSSI